MDVTAHDDVPFSPTERDPWIFYWSGKNNYVLLTSDLEFKGLFTHQAAIALGRTAVFSFTGRTFNSERRGAAFLKAQLSIFKMLRRQRKPFIATIQLDGKIYLDSANPSPSRLKVEPQDWDSYERVCRAESIDSEPRNQDSQTT
jgi:hypothetical protein